MWPEETTINGPSKFLNGDQGKTLIEVHVDDQQGGLKRFRRNFVLVAQHREMWKTLICPAVNSSG